ncbi:radical SAM/SPASM domain-containing protein [Nonomuraea endophytica]|uniref:MoaA/NifB/PqqE/SkfB family radical SAM enzyme n=1 Tax=Nonomuraea endophytica TaxID=714136 RepID=A0A7W7ZX17_9ACTN|nr:radical SAM/SPASM domain-containing protein [Nonomuraea endophytica]MBB5075019.1 MoaA/NifB/PqqE/SkfB family radical SAM enzyme [Nonomuraea endophytica]
MSAAPPALDFVWAEITGKCQLACTHCYADSGPTGTHGVMTIHDWLTAINQVVRLGARMIQLIGGEPTLHPGLPELVGHALGQGLEVEVYTNLVHVTPSMWDMFAQSGVRLATSYYTGDADQHQQITGRKTLHRTRTNIAQAIALGIPLRAGVIDVQDGQDVDAARAQLAQLGVTDVGVDRMRLLGRPARGACDASELCGRCGDRKVAILSNGTVAPCPLGRWLSAGDIRTDSLASLAGQVQQLARQAISPGRPDACRPPCEPQCHPGQNQCAPDKDGCVPQSRCNPSEPCKPKNPCKPDVTPPKK